jgi:hypothetical protein
MSIKRIGTALGVGVVALAFLPWGRLRAQSGPVVTAPETIQETTTIPVVGDVLDPPPAGYQPTVTWQSAVAIAKAWEDASSATSIRPVLALFTNPNEVPVTNERQEAPAITGPPLVVKVPAWLVTIEGVCIPFYGGHAGAIECGGHQATVVINADSGDVIEEFSYQ